MKKFLLLTIFPLITFILFFTSVKADTTRTVIISTLYPHQLTTDKEYIEIKNVTNSNIDISNYYFRDGGSHCLPTDVDTDKSIFYLDTVTTTSTRVIPGKSLAPNEIYKVYTNRRLNDTGDEVVLCKNDHTEIDDVKYCSTVATGETIIRDSNYIPQILQTNGVTKTACTTVIPTLTPTSAPTPTATISPTIQITPTPIVTTPIITPTQSITPLPTLTPVVTATQNPSITNTPIIENYKTWGISLQIILPNPNDGIEKITIKNNSNQLRNLDGWKIDDSKSTASIFKKFTNTDAINPGEEIVAENKSSVLNNSGDEVYLIAPDGTEIEYYKYISTDKDQKWYKNEQGQWITDKTSSINTDGEVLGASDSSGQDETIEDAKLENDDSPVNIQGTVTSDPNLLGKNILYVQDNTAGIRIDLNSNTNIKLGDFVKVTGTVSDIKDERRIKADTITKSGALTAPDPKLIKKSDISEKLEGTLVQITGIVTSTNGNSFEIDEIPVYINTNTGIKKPATRVGYYAQITGILTQYGTKNDEPYYRILPRYQSDVKISKTKELLANTGSNALVNMALGIIILIVVATVIRRRKRI